MATLANQEDLVELLLDGARYGDMEDVVAAVEQHRCSPDAADEAGKTGACTSAFLVIGRHNVVKYNPPCYLMSALPSTPQPSLPRRQVSSNPSYSKVSLSVRVQHYIWRARMDMQK